MKYKFGDDIFLRIKAKQNEWRISDKDFNNKIALLQQDPNHTSDIRKWMELQQLYYLSSDLGNASYQGYQIMTKTERDSENTAWLRENSPGYKTMKSNYEIEKFRNDEYFHLVFPLAAKLNIPYIYPIDDLSTWKEYEKYFERLQIPDTIDKGKIKFRNYTEFYLKNLKSLPLDSSQWMFMNSPEIIQNAIYGTGYRIDPDISNEDVKRLHYYWVLRNKMMAQYIAEVALKYPNKRIVVFFGAGHIGSVREELNNLNQSYQVLTLSNLTK